VAEGALEGIVVGAVHARYAGAGAEADAASIGDE
jgi:hypothetical protein